MGGRRRSRLPRLCGASKKTKSMHLKRENVHLLDGPVERLCRAWPTSYPASTSVKSPWTFQMTSPWAVQVTWKVHGPFKVIWTETAMAVSWPLPQEKMRSAIGPPSTAYPLQQSMDNGNGSGQWPLSCRAYLILLWVSGRDGHAERLLALLL